MATHWMLAVFLFLLPVSNALPEVDELDGEGDFRSITLHWKYDRDVSGRYHFIVTYCEDQSWGKYRCKKQEIEESNAIQSTSSDKKYHAFETVISGLRMSTNYTLEVTPVFEGENSNRGRAFGREIIVRTKGCFMSPQEEPRAIEETSSMEAVVRDYTTGDTAPTCVENPVALFQTSFMTGLETASGNLYDLRDDHMTDLEVEDLCRPPAVEAQIGDFDIDLPELGATDICQLSVHDLPVLDIPNAFLPELSDSLCFDPLGHVIDLGHDDHMLESGHPVETFNPLPHIIGQSPDSDPLTMDPCPPFDLPPSPFADEYPLPPDIYHSPNSSIIVLDPLALHHQSLLLLPAPVLEDEFMVGSCPPPMSLQHVPQAFFEDQLPQGIILDQEDDDVFESSSDGEGDLPGGIKFQEGEEEEEESVFDRHLNEEDREKAISRRPSLDQNWKLGDGEGQIFPAFSQ
ncbi:uncharacterized protein [Palaemon carinicauda]|uniref:uncharacterized protein n=1 Tax=Palaemon carinicauda TaxID=392227 RepID=UPI0035B68A31